MIHVMPLDRGGRIVFRFAITGFSLGVLAAFCIAMYVPSLAMSGFVIVCPGMLLAYPEAWGVRWAMWTNLLLIALANAAVYSVVGAIIAGLTTKPKQG
jgi:hypothetical protein